MNEKTQRFYLKSIYNKHSVLQRTFVSCLRSWETRGLKGARRRVKNTEKHSSHRNKENKNELEISYHVTKENTKRVGQEVRPGSQQGYWSPGTIRHHCANIEEGRDKLISLMYVAGEVPLREASLSRIPPHGSRQKRNEDDCSNRTRVDQRA